MKANEREKEFEILRNNFNYSKLTDSSFIQMGKTIKRMHILLIKKKEEILTNGK